MNRLVHYDGTETRKDARGMRFLVPIRVARERCQRWEISTRVYVASELDENREIVYRETHWEVPHLEWWADSRGRYHRFDPEPGVYYCPE